VKLKRGCGDIVENADGNEKENENGVVMVFDWEFIFMWRGITLGVSLMRE